MSETISAHEAQVQILAEEIAGLYVTISGLRVQNAQLRQQVESLAQQNAANQDDHNSA